MILVPGTLVKHPGQPSRGPGEILPGGVAGKVRVRFAGAGEKALSLAHVQLEVIGRAEAERLRVEMRNTPAPPIPGPDPENPDAERAFELLQGKEPCVFVTGRAGTGKSSQYPLRPAWAITIHKSHGQTLERIVVDLGRGAFEHGQVYVALSRCPTLEGITLATEIWPNDVLKVSGHVREFMDSVAKAALLPGSEGRIAAGGRNMLEGKS